LPVCADPADAASAAQASAASAMLRRFLIGGTPFR
jgi:hypothetical protein